MDHEISIKKYDNSKKSEWDDFVNSSVNGTFLQTKQFLDYHPADRFVDSSLMVYDQDKLVAVCPACIISDKGEKIFFSHKGSTFGGVIIGAKQCALHKILPIISGIEEYCESNEFSKIVLKQTSDLFCGKKSDLIDFALYYLGYIEKKELNFYIDFSQYDDKILSNFSQGKRTNINNCLKKGIEVKKINTETQINDFYCILCTTLEKYGKTPVHTLDELLLLKNSIIAEEVEFFGAYLENKMIAGSMMFYFRNANVAHTQYLCALPEYDTLSPMSFMYYTMIENAKRKSFDMISFGIATEDEGRYINSGLAASKEAFGAKHSVNKIYYKSLVNKGAQI